MSTPPIANGWGYGGFLYGYNATINLPASGDLYDPAEYLSAPFPSLGTPLPNVSPGAANYNTAVTTARNGDRPGYVQNWNASIQHQFPSQILLEAAYVGNKGTRVWGGSAFSNYDVLAARLLTEMGSVLNSSVSQYPQYIPYAGFPATSSVAQALLPYPQFYGVNEQFPYFTNSTHHSLQVAATRHLTSNLGFLAAYTWSKTLGYVDSNGPMGYNTNPQDYFNRGLEHSVASFNLPHVVKLTWTYETPFGRRRRWDLHWANPILGGWQFAAIHNYSTGFPVAVYEAGLNIPAGFGGIRPDVVVGQAAALAPVPSHVDAQVSSPYLNPAAFAHSPVAADGTPLRVGTAPRFLADVRGPAQYSETVQMSKRFYFGEERRFLQAGATMSNPLKRTKPYIVDTTVGDAQFGQVQMGGGDRILQIQARLEF